MKALPRGDDGGAHSNGAESKRRGDHQDLNGGLAPGDDASPGFKRF